MNKSALPAITCIILTKNEEVNIPRCIASVRWCNEIIVVDSGSADKTLEVAELLGARVFSNPPQGVFNIANQRNWSLETAGVTTEWVLFLDADEEITPELQKAITATIANPGDKNCFELTPKYLFWGRWLKRTQNYPNWHPRIVQHGKVCFAGGVWEHFEDGARAGRICEPYNHYANSKGLSDWLNRHDRYSTWDATKIARYLATRDPASLGTTRKLYLRQWAAALYPIRPFIRFFSMYFGRLGFLEGVASLVFCTLYFFYEFMTVVKIIEIKRKESGRAL
jgi:glycosyltransferase involved in cell wall biosynthesis